MRRAFSLFTPLVGTALIVLTILTASMLAENDLRTSRALASSSAATRDYITAKQVKAAIDSTAYTKLHEKTIEYTTDKSFMTVTCSSPTDCQDKLEEKFVPGSLWKSLCGEGIFTSFDSPVRDSLGEDGTVLNIPESTETFSAIWGTAPFQTRFTDNKACITINKEDVDKAENSTGDPLIISFSSQETNRMQVKLTLSEDITYCTQQNLQKIIEHTSELINGPEGKDCTGWIADGFKKAMVKTKTPLDITEEEKNKVEACWGESETCITIREPGYNLLGTESTGQEYYCYADTNTLER